MNIDEAIMNLRSLQESEHMKGMTSQIMSIKLGIMALQRIRSLREAHLYALASVLPGETGYPPPKPAPEPARVLFQKRGRPPGSLNKNKVGL